MQQQIMPVFSRPKHDTWEGVAAIMDTYPGQHVLYGYVSDDTLEEEIAVERASTSGKYLVPTHNVSKLSFHSAVRGNSPLRSPDPFRAFTTYFKALRFKAEFSGITMRQDNGTIISFLVSIP
jgi:hypothetical protein